MWPRIITGNAQVLFIPRLETGASSVKPLRGWARFISEQTFERLWVRLRRALDWMRKMELRGTTVSSPGGA